MSKKIILSVITIGVFSFYALFERGNNDTPIATVVANQLSGQSQSAAYASTQGSAGASPNPSTAQTSQAQAQAQAQAQQQAAAQRQAAAQAAAQQQAAAQAQQSSGQYRNGTYTGPSVNVYYGNVQVAAVITGGKLADVKILQYPNDRSTSIQIADYALPQLTQEAISAQSAQVNGVSGASATSQGFVQSLGAALSKASA